MHEPSRRRALLVTILAVLALALGGPACRRAPDDATSTHRAFKVERRGPPERCEVEQAPDGSLTVRVFAFDGTSRTLSPDDYARWLLNPPEAAGWRAMLNVSGWVGVLWVCIGFLGQAIFTGRMLVQWIASERAKASVVPMPFWWMSLGGSLLLGAYFAWRQDVVGFLGQSAGIVVYLRNLHLIRRVRGT